MFLVQHDCPLVEGALYLLRVEQHVLADGLDGVVLTVLWQLCQVDATEGTPPQCALDPKALQCDVLEV